MVATLNITAAVHTHTDTDSIIFLAPKHMQPPFQCGSYLGKWVVWDVENTSKLNNTSGLRHDEG